MTNLLMFEPGSATMALLQREHVNNTWVGKELLPIANRIRNDGGTEGDYLRWVTASHLWASYTGSTSDSASDQRKHLGGAWDKSEQSKPFELHDVMAELIGRIENGSWPGRAGNRNRAVALAFIGFCRDGNCYTRTMSKYELAKHTPGISSDAVGRALADLIKLGLLTKVARTDRRPSGRSTSRYHVNLYWKPRPCNPNGISAPRNTGNNSLMHMCHNGDTSSVVDLSRHDLWTHPRGGSRGLGQTAFRVWECLAEHPGPDFFESAAAKSVADLAAESGLARRTVDTALRRLFDNCMAVELPGRPHRWLRAAYPPVDALAEALGCAGILAEHVSRIEKRQHANRTAYPRAYRTELPEGMTA